MQAAPSGRRERGRAAATGGWEVRAGTTAAERGAGGPGDSHRHPMVAWHAWGVADRACRLEVPLGHGTTGDSIPEGRKWGATGPGSLTPEGHWREPGQVFGRRLGLITQLRPRRSQREDEEGLWAEEGPCPALSHGWGGGWGVGGGKRCRGLGFSQVRG